MSSFETNIILKEVGGYADAVTTMDAVIANITGTLPEKQVMESSVDPGVGQISIKIINTTFTQKLADETWIKDNHGAKVTFYQSNYIP